MNSYLFGIEKARKHFEFSEQKSREYLSEIKRLIVEEIEKAQNIKEFREFIVDAERLRNNLAHGNSSEEIENPKLNFKRLLIDFKRFCLDEDIFGVKKWKLFLF